MCNDACVTCCVRRCQCPNITNMSMACCGFDGLQMEQNDPAMQEVFHNVWKAKQFSVRSIALWGKEEFYGYHEGQCNNNCLYGLVCKNTCLCVICSLINLTSGVWKYHDIRRLQMQLKMQQR